MKASAEMPTTPAARPSRPSMKFTALTVTTMIRIVTVAQVRLERHRPAPGKRYPGDGRAGPDHDAAGRDLPGQLGQGADLPAVIDDPDQHQQPRRRQQSGHRARRREG